MAYLRTSALGLAAALACVTVADAQSMSGTVRARVSYDDAAARSSDALAAARGLQNDDVIGDILATFDITRPVGRQTISASGSVGYDFHRKNTQLDRERVSVNAGVQRDFGMCNTSLTGSYSRSQTDLEDLEFEPIKNTTEATTINASAACRRLIGIAPTFSIGKTWVENTADARQQSNSDLLNASVGLAYFRPALGSVSVYWQYSEANYSNRLILVNGQLQNDGFESYSAGLRYTRRIGARLQGNLFAAYTETNPDLPGVESFEGVTYGGSLSYRPTSRLTTTASFDRNTKPSNRLDSTYSLAESYSLGASYALGARMTLTLDGTHRSQQIEGPLLTPGVDITEENTDSISGSLNFKLNRRLSLSLDATHRERSADVAGFDYESQRVGLTATAGF